MYRGLNTHIPSVLFHPWHAGLLIMRGIFFLEHFVPQLGDDCCLAEGSWDEPASSCHFYLPASVFQVTFWR